LADSEYSLAQLLINAGHFKEAEAALADAVAILRKLAADFPDHPEYRQVLAQNHSGLGDLFRATGRLKESEAASSEALGIQKQLTMDFPGRREFRSSLTGYLNNYGFLLQRLGRPQDAERTYVDALETAKPLVGDRYSRPDDRNLLAGILVNLAGICRERRDFHQARKYLQEALPHHHAAVQANSRNTHYLTFLRNNLVVQAWANAALRDQNGALRAAEQIRDLGWDPPTHAYDTACVLAHCITIVEQDESLSAVERLSSRQFYGDEAMTMLHVAVAKGYRDAAHMKTNAGLNPLRVRRDFGVLMMDVAMPANPFAID
jgi:tetratricopeptide (TPR) repeat protein